MQLPDTIIDHKKRIAHRQSFRKVRILAEEVVGIADREDRRNNSQIISRRDAFDFIDIREVFRPHLGQPGELGVSQQDVCISSRTRALPDAFERRDVFIDEEIGAVIKPLLQDRLCPKAAGGAGG